MIDTIAIFYEDYSDCNVNFIKNLDGKLSDQELGTRNNGFTKLKGRLRNLRITATEKTIRIVGSFAKYYFGENIRELKASQIREIVDELSIILGVDISNGKITQLHSGINIELPFRTNVLFKGLGQMPYMNRFEQKDSIYYQNKSRKLVIYDKTKESKQNSISGKNITRIELRYEKNIGFRFKGGLKVSDLYKQELLFQLQSDVIELFNSINKISQNVHLSPTEKPSILVNQLAAFGIKMIGYNNVYNQIIEWNERRQIQYNKHYRNLDKLKELQSISLYYNDDSVLFSINSQINHHVNLSQL